MRAQSAAGAAYATEVRPILEKNCYGCHTDKMRGGLRLDSLEAILRGGGSGPAIVPGDPKASLLMDAVSYADEALEMPPSGPLTAADIAVLERWIRTDAKREAAALHSAQPVAAEHGLQPVAMAAPMSPRAASAQEQFFETSVRPLLARRCYGCHTDGESGGLRLDSRKSMLAGGKDGVVVDLANPDKSLLLRAVHYADSRIKMPPSGQMSPAEIAILEQWIADGAAWPAGETTRYAGLQVTDKDREFWAWKRPVMPAVPQVQSRWAYNDVDRFVLAGLRNAHLEPVHDADRRTMIRRVTYDLTGLPPTPEEVAAYLADKRPDAYARLVERLLGSRAYAERWGRMWLDVVRYSDTSGEGADFPIPQMYKYRDYVVDSFAKDESYDRFIREQLAGDLLPAASEAEHWRNTIATGYIANASYTDDPVSDTVDNVGYSFLGTTVGCARCHDHKFDPIPTADYYGMYGVFASTRYAKPGLEETRWQQDLVYRDPKATTSQEYVDFQTQLKPVADTIHAAHQLPYFDDILPALEARRMALFQNEPKFETAYAVAEGTPHNERIQRGGSKENLGPEVQRHFLQILGNADLPTNAKDSGRLELANWIASPENPLTARVMVNRIWQGHFGRGIVATPNDFGRRGMAPSDQPLLDYLAVSFMRNGWSIKSLHRMILLSHAYQLSTVGDAEAEKIDPENTLLWRHSRMRMDAEEIRDSMLETSGLLDQTTAGAQPFPAPGEWNYSGHAPFHAVYETNKRTLYVMVQRTRRHPYLGLFDGADAGASVAQRQQSVTPLQALYFMNNAFPRQCAESLAGQLATAHRTREQQIERAFLLLYQRPVTRAELERMDEFLTRAERIYRQHAAPGKPVDAEEAERRAFKTLLEALYASNEFMFID